MTIAFVHVIGLLVLLACQGASSQEHTAKIYNITAGNGTGSLTDLLQEDSLVVSSFTTLSFSAGVHHMCEDSVVVIRDVINISLIGSEITNIKSVQVGDEEMVDIIEPSTVIDCHGCRTGFAFINVSELFIQKITFMRCGGDIYPVLLSIGPQEMSSLSVETVYNLTIDKVLFINSTRMYSLKALNVLGHSTIKDISVLQGVPSSGLGNYYLGSISLSFRDNVYPPIINTTASLDVESMTFFMTKGGDSFTSYLKIETSSSCHINVTLKFITIYLQINFPPNTTYLDRLRIQGMVCAVAIGVRMNAGNYQIDLQTVRISGSEQEANLDQAIILTYRDDDDSSIRSLGRVTVTDLKITQWFIGVRILRTSMCKMEHFHKVVFDWCDIPNVEIKGGCGEPTSDLLEEFLMTFLKPSGELDISAYPITIRNTKIEKKNNRVGWDSSLMFIFNTMNLLIDNSVFLNNHGGSGLHLNSSVVHFRGNCTFYNNTANYGGGIVMTGSQPILFLLPNTTLNFTKNSALITGGAIHISTTHKSSATLLPHEKQCYIQAIWHPFKPSERDMFELKYQMDVQNIHLVFRDNSALAAGSILWGGSVDQSCFLNPLTYRELYVVIGTTYLKPLFNGLNTESDPSAISSSPQRVCICNGTTQCTSKMMYGGHFILYPGQSVKINVALAGQLNGFVPGLIQATLRQGEEPDTDSHLEDLQRIQRIHHSRCTEQEFTIYSSRVNNEFNLTLYLAELAEYESVQLNYVGRMSFNSSQRLESHWVRVVFSINLLDCPAGFQHNTSIRSCVCLQLLLKYMDNTSCDIDTQTVQRTPTRWMNLLTTGNKAQTLAIHQHCPFDYCDPNKLRVDLSHPDQQCAHNRSGVLCGGCQRGLSITLGSPKCVQCSNRFLSLFLVFPTAGIALVAVLTCLNLTVSVGTINGLILYANVIQAIHPVFFPSTNFLSVFVAWMNLDIGLESCLYDGMDFYVLTWLQFVFPVYIWLLVSVMIITSHYSTTAAKLVSRDAVKVLATLFLLSYAKLLRTIITVLSFTYISYEGSDGTAYRTAVWLYDGSVQFVKGKHIPLFLIAIGFGLFYIIPFTFLLFFAPHLQAKSHRYRVLRWVDKLMPFFDAYQGPYDSQFRFWTGILLISRVVLFVGFAFNTLGDPQINLMLILTVLVTLSSFQWLLGTWFSSKVPYNSSFNNYLEMFYLGNLGVLSTWSLLQMDSNTTSRRAQTITSSVCVGLAFLVFFCILLYHTYLRLMRMDYVKDLWRRIRFKVCCMAGPSLPSSQPTPQQPHRAVKNTFIELRESLLTSD